MRNQGRNDGLRVLDDFVCEALHSPDVPQADEQHQERNEGLQVVEDLYFDTTRSDEIQFPATGDALLPHALDAAIKSEAARLAVIISTSIDPCSTLALFQKLLVAELGKATNGR